LQSHDVLARSGVLEKDKDFTIEDAQYTERRKDD